MQTSAPPADFYTGWTLNPEPHSSRKAAILKKHPDVARLYGHDPRSKWWVMLSVALQLITAYLVRDASWWIILPLAYAWGGTINHSLQLTAHELCHNLFFANPTHNLLFGFVANIPIPPAMMVTFKKYHLMHHLYQGQDGWDPDLPTKWEADFFRGPVRKLLFLCLQPVIYTLRPLFRQPLPLSRWEIAQWMSQITIHTLIVLFFGAKSFYYLLLSSFLGASIHPLAAHFVAEHYEWEKGAETYSYYGPFNKLTYNVGYHYEHHDFPRIAGPRLPELTQLAPEFYEHLPQHKSWLAVMWRFIWDDALGPASRTVRPYKAHGVTSVPDYEKETSQSKLG